MKSLSVSLSLLLGLTPLPAQDSGLRIAIVEGDGAINNIKQKVNVEPVIEVQDDNRKPVPGAAVVFFLPSQGPGGIFSNGSKTLTATTDRAGRAAARGIQYSQTGKFEIRITASYQGQSASASITQTNVSGSSASGQGGGISAKALIILVAAAGAVAGGVLAATHGGGGSSSSGPVPIVITAGTPTVGGPH